MSENQTGLIIYQTEDGKTKIDVHMENETVWLAELLNIAHKAILLFLSSFVIPRNTESAVIEKPAIFSNSPI